MSSRNRFSFAPTGLVFVLALLAGALAPTVEAGAARPAAPLRRGKTFLTRDEALALAFPGCEVERGTSYLREADVEAVAKLAGVSFDTKVVHPYVARKEGELVGTAYFDTHKVRTLRQTLMVVVDADGKLSRVELLSFGEPLDYVPRDLWYAQFAGASLDAELQLKRRIKPVTGATLTARATTDSARRMLALHQTLARLAKEKEAARKKREEERRRKRVGDGTPPSGANGA